MSDFAENQGPAPISAPPTNLRNGPAWEDQSRPLFQRWMETVKGVFSRPEEFFSTMRQEGGIGAPLTFGVIGGSIGVIVGQIYSMIFNASIFSVVMASAGRQASERAAVQMGANLIMNIAYIIFAPVLVAIGLFISAGICHLLLMLFKGANKPFETTFRVIAYVNGALGLLGVIPFCGALIMMVWMIIAEIIGLARAHETTMGKSALAVLTPLVLCICCVIFGVAIFGAGMFALVASHH